MYFIDFLPFHKRKRIKQLVVKASMEAAYKYFKSSACFLAASDQSYESLVPLLARLWTDLTNWTLADSLCSLTSTTNVADENLACSVSGPPS